MQNNFSDAGNESLNATSIPYLEFEDINKRVIGYLDRKFSNHTQIATKKKQIGKALEQRKPRPHSAVIDGTK